MEVMSKRNEIELLREKYLRHEKILVQAYKSLKQKEQELKKLNKELSESKEELQTVNNQLNIVNDELLSKNEIINNQNTELKATLDYLKETQTQLFQAEKMASLGVLTAGIAHEINNPLNYIMGSCVGLENYFKDNNIDNKDVQVFLNALETGVNRAAKIVKGLNQFSRSNDNYNEECDLHSIIDNGLVILHTQWANNIEIIKDFEKEPIRIPGNVGKLHEVMLNILTNAIQSIVKKGRITIVTSTNKEFANIEISDSGIGISEKDLLKVMEPFYTTKAPGKGTGLGMSITYNIIKEHKGRINISSKREVGTKVEISLPLYEHNKREV